MLVLSRKIGETIRVGSEIELVVLDVNRGRVKLGFAGPRDVEIRRGELTDTHQHALVSSVVARPQALEDDANGSELAPLRAYRQTGAGV